jgi:hypothetical protein
MDPIEQVRAFAEANDLEGKWSSARQMMSSKAKPNGEQFYSLLQQAFEGLGHIAEAGDGSSRLQADAPEIALQYPDLRSAVRRYAIPCFEHSVDDVPSAQRAKWAQEVLANALLQAQVVADTLSGECP